MTKFCLVFATVCEMKGFYAIADENIAKIDAEINDTVNPFTKFDLYKLRTEVLTKRARVEQCMVEAAEIYSHGIDEITKAISIDPVYADVVETIFIDRLKNVTVGVLS